MDMIKKHKKTLIWIGAVVVVIALALIINHRYKRTHAPVGGEELPVTALPEATPAHSQSPKETVASATKNYTADLARYGSKRVQFGAQCDPSPKRAVFTKGETVMLDNRSAQLHGFSIGNQNVVIPAYDYALVTLSEKGTFLVNCGALTNAATIIVQ